MQDLRAIAGGAAGRFFGAPGGGPSAGPVGGCTAPGAAPAAASASASGTHQDRRLRPHPQQNLRCPRCDSLNTKFCYYNNYNLSQPRHFCKSCRRYWTKGGVLRNVPVGGGCRKSKRSSSSSSSSTSSSSKTSKSSSNGCKDHCREPPAAPSSSDSSSLTASAADAPTVTEEPGTPPPPAALDSYATTLLDSISEGAAAGIFPETGSFTSLIAAAGNPDIMDLNFAAGGPQLHLQQEHRPKAALSQPRTGLEEGEIRMPAIPVADGYMDQIAHMDVLLPPTQGRPAAGPPLATLDWPGGVDTPGGLFDASAVAVAGDHGGYWNQSQWGEIDPSLFLP